MIKQSLLLLFVSTLYFIGATTFNSAEHDLRSNPHTIRRKRQLVRALGSVYRFVSENSCSRGQKCYGNLGCFQCRYGYHVEPPKTVNPQFYFYAPNEDLRVLNFFGNLAASIDRMRFKSIRGNKPDLWVIIHGFNPGPWPLQWVVEQANALVEKGHNVLIVNWVEGVAYPNYLQAASNSRLVAGAVAKVLSLIETRKHISRRSMNIVGFSLGAHISGWVGERLRGIRRIIGLDPAGPLFTAAAPVDRLDPTDAYYVQCIHTNGNKFLPAGGLGTLQPFGHVDFYPNGGKKQPGCPKTEKLNIVKDLSRLIVEECDHYLANEIFTQSIKQFGQGDDVCKYHAYQCQSSDEWESGRCFKCPASGCSPVGYAAAMLTDVTLRGKLYFSTYEKEKCGKQFMILLQPASSVDGELEVGLKDSDSGQFASRVLLKDSKPLQEGSLRAVNIAAQFQKPSQVLVFYEKSTPALLGLLGSSGGATQWNLKGVTVLSDDGMRYDSVQPELVTSGFTTAVQLVTAN